MKFSWKNIKNWRSWKISFFNQPFWFFFSKKKKKMLHFNKNKQPVQMRYHFFLHYGWFFQNLGKEAVRNFMHRTVHDIFFKYAYYKHTCLLFHNFMFSTKSLHKQHSYVKMTKNYGRTPTLFLWHYSINERIIGRGYLFLPKQLLVRFP